MSLKSWVKEMTENGSEFPSDLFGAFIGKKAKIVKGNRMANTPAKTGF